MWCWAPKGDAASKHGCKDAASLGKGACMVNEKCCDGYGCWNAGQCTAGAPGEDADKSTRKLDKLGGTKCPADGGDAKKTTKKPSGTAGGTAKVTSDAKY